MAACYPNPTSASWFQNTQQNPAKATAPSLPAPDSPLPVKESTTALRLAALHLGVYERIPSTLLDYHQIRTGRGKEQRGWSQIFLPGCQRRQIKGFGQSTVLHTAHTTRGEEGQPSHLHTAALHHRSRRGIALGHVSWMMQWNASDLISEGTGSHTRGNRFPFIPSLISGCIHLASGQWRQQHFCMEGASQNHISATTEEILKLWPVLSPFPPKFSSFSAKYWWHSSGLESQMRPELRKHYKSICSNIYSEIFHATPTMDFSLLRT